MDENDTMMILHSIKSSIARWEEEQTEPSKILGTQSSEFRGPAQVLPSGKYICIVESYDRKNHDIWFVFRPIKAESDVDRVELEMVGGLEGKVINGHLWLNEYGARTLVKLLDDCGIADGIVRERIERLPECQVGLTVRRWKTGIVADWDGESYPSPKLDQRVEEAAKRVLSQLKNKLGGNGHV
jgi:hypothetical protein